MLIEFSVANFRSFREKQTLSMVADNLKEHEAVNTFDPALKSFPRLLRSAAIFGANAAGKTNLLRALQYTKEVVVSGAAAPTSAQHEYTPFRFSSECVELPSEFEITFAQNGRRYEYGFSIDAERIQSEWLIEHVHARGRELFSRKYNRKKEVDEYRYSTAYLKGQKALWSESTRPNALFLSTAVQLNSTQLLPVYEWFSRRLIVIVGTISLNESLTVKLLADPRGKGKDKILPFLLEADLGISDLKITRERMPSGGYVVGEVPAMIEQPAGGGAPRLLKVTFTHNWAEGVKNSALDFEDESSGAQIFFKNAGAWLNVLEKGEVLVVDEIDTSLHPMLVRFLVQRFHSNRTNPENAQLIFNTHDLSLLDQELFRRDQIWFVEKNNDGASCLYPLSDFRPRNDERLATWYMRGRYGALPLLNTGDN